MTAWFNRITYLRTFLEPWFRSTAPTKFAPKRIILISCKSWVIINSPYIAVVKALNCHCSRSGFSYLLFTAIFASITVLSSRTAIACNWRTSTCSFLIYVTYWSWDAAINQSAHLTSLCFLWLWRLICSYLYLGFCDQFSNEMQLHGSPPLLLRKLTNLEKMKWPLEPPHLLKRFHSFCIPFIYISNRSIRIVYL